MKLRYPGAESYWGPVLPAHPHLFVTEAEDSEPSDVLLAAPLLSSIPPPLVMEIGRHQGPISRESEPSPPLRTRMRGELGRARTHTNPTRLINTIWRVKIFYAQNPI
jgi:hypothetical protein